MILAITLNPGFALLAAAALALAAPTAWLAHVRLFGALAALALIFSPPFGEYAAFQQIGLRVVPLRLDALSQVFGLGFAIVAALTGLAGGRGMTRFETAALLVHAGGAMAALFAGDLVSFAAALQLAALGAVCLAFAPGGPAARRAGAVAAGILAPAGAMLAIAIGLIWAETGAVAFERLDLDRPGGLLAFAAILIAAGAPLAHVWLSGAVAAASPAGAAALAAFLPNAAVYAALRAAQGEPALLWVGGTMALGAACLALASPAPRRAMGYGAAAQSGLALTAAGLGGPLALAGAAALAFGHMLSAVVTQIAVHAAIAQAGGRAGGLWRTSPLLALFAVIGAASAIGMPGFAGFVGLSMALEAAALESRPAVWIVLAAGAAAGVAHLGGHGPVRTFFADAPPKDAAAAPFDLQLALTIGCFLCLAVGLAPQWLIALTPPGRVVHEPYTWSNVLGRLEMLAAAAFAYGIAAIVLTRAGWRGPAPGDVDALYRGPVLALARRTGAGAAAASAWAERTGARAAGWAARAAGRRFRALDQALTAPRAAVGALLATAAGLVLSALFGSV